MTKDKVASITTRRVTAVAAVFALVLGLGLLVGGALTGCAQPQGEEVLALAEGPDTAILPTLPAAQTATRARAQALAPATAATALPSLTPLPTATATDLPTAVPTTVVPTATNTAVPTPTGTPPAPLPTPVGVYSWTLKVPILMYHYISTPPENADKYRLDLSVTPAEFERQMTYLAENGYETVSLYDLSLAISAKRDLPEKPVIITLDDGYVDNYENALPILQKHGLRATFFVVTQFVDEGRVGYLTWDMVKEMSAAGMSIEPHSKTHPDLSGAERDFVIYEMLGSQQTIAAHIGSTPRFFCYPGGRYDQQTMDIAAELDLWGAVTTADGQWHGFDNRYEWSRVRMRNSTTLPEFAAMIAPGNTVGGKAPQE